MFDRLKILHIEFIRGIDTMLRIAKAVETLAVAASQIATRGVLYHYTCNDCMFDPECDKCHRLASVVQPEIYKPVKPRASVERSDT